MTTGDRSAATALADNAETSGRLRDVLTQHGIPTRQIQTARFDLSPLYEGATGNEQPRLAGYRVSHAFSVSYADLEKAGTLLDALIKAGGNVVQGVRFSVAEPAESLTHAQKLAVSDAIAKATTLAEAPGRQLRPIRRLIEGNPSPGAHLAGGAMEMRVIGVIAASPITVGEQTMRVDVTLLFTLD